MKELFRLGGNPQIGKTKELILSLTGIVILLGILQGITSYGLIPPKILPSPLSVLRSIPDLVTTYGLPQNAWYSIKMNFMAYLYAIGISIPLGFLLSLFPIINIVLGKYLNSIRYLPVPAVSGIFIALFGLTFVMKTNFLAFGLLIFILPTVASKVNDLQNPVNDKDNVYLQTAQTLGASGWQRFRDIYWPFVLREISGEIITLTSISWSYVTISEMLYKDGTVSGIGALINTMIRQSHMPEAYACILTVILIGVLQDILLKSLDKFLFPSKYGKKSILKSYYVKDNE